MHQVTGLSQRNQAGEDIITLDLEPDNVVGPTQGTTPQVSACKSTNHRGVKRSLTYSSNTAPEFNEETVSEEVNYPTYLYQPAPSKLKIDELQRHACISVIKKNNTMCTFFELAKGILGPLKDALVSAVGNEVGEKSNKSDHNYQATNPTC